MKRAKIVLTSLTFALALTGVLVVKANEKKRTTTTIGWFSNSVGTVKITLDQSRFDDAGINFVTKIIDDNNAQKQIFKNSNLSGDLRLIP